MTTRERMPIVASALAVASALLISCSTSNVKPFLSGLPGTATIVALANVRVIDGTGAPGRDDQTIVIDSGRIAAMGRSSDVRIPDTAKTLDLRGRTVMPGLVGMHDHLFYHAGGADQTVGAQESFAMLYLATGVTTIRTAGSVDFDADLRIKRLIDEGKRPGPSIHITSPYLHAQTPAPDPARVVRDVNAWADRGATSFKAYMSLRHDELEAAIETAHARGLKVTGHLCAVGFQEAANLGIDNLEHGLLQDSEFTKNKQPDQCPDPSETLATVLSMNVAGPSVQRTISTLVQRGVALTSTLAIFETFASRARLDERTLQVLAPRVLARYRERQSELTEENRTARWWNELLRKEMDFERAFVAAGGRMVAGVDPTGWGGIVAGFGDQRQLELLVAAGLTPEAAIRVATANGAAHLNETAIGYLAPGMQADLLVVRGNPSADISDIRHVEVVFKKGVGYDPDALIAAAAGTVGALDLWQIIRWPYGPLMLAVILILIGLRVARHRKPITRQ